MNLARDMLEVRAAFLWNNLIRIASGEVSAFIALAGASAAHTKWLACTG